jgi:hypothetical protein
MRFANIQETYIVADRVFIYKTAQAAFDFEFAEPDFDCHFPDAHNAQENLSRAIRENIPDFVSQPIVLSYNPKKRMRIQQISHYI